MSKIGNSSIILVGILLLVLGIIVASNLIEALVAIILKLFGWGIGITGVVLLVYGMVKLFKGSGSRQSDY